LTAVVVVPVEVEVDVARVVATEVVLGESLVCRPDRTRRTAIVTAARNAAGAP
jgi:hypothetical protein